MSGPGDVRVGPIAALPEVLTDFGVSPGRALRHAGVDPQLFDNPENRIQIETLGHLFETCVELTDCLHFGLQVGARFDLQGLGLLGEAMRNAATLGTALRILMQHLHLYDRGAAPLLYAAGNRDVIFGYTVCRHGTPAVPQILDAGLAIGARILTTLCGRGWSASYVQFPHHRPEDTKPYRQIFRTDLRFEADAPGLVFPKSWLEKPIPGADADIHAESVTAMHSTEEHVTMSFTQRMEGMLPQLLLSGMGSSAKVAELFAIDERTLRRRLAKEGSSLRQLINQGRFVLAKQLLEDTELPVSAIATALHYDDANAFSRAFRTWAHISPTQWRAQH
jgi:AraC-like DNA-binding protein